jgi:hypothetical protein
MKNINRFFFIILVVLFVSGIASLLFAIRYAHKEKSSPPLSEPQEVSSMKSNAPPVDEISPKQVPKELNPVQIPESQKKVVSTLESPKADEKVDSSEEPSGVSSSPLKDVLDLEKKRAAIIKQLILEKSKTPDTVPSSPDKGKTWAEVGDQLMELEQQRENSINSLSTKVNQQDGK